MQVCFTGSAQPVICCETVLRQKQNCTKIYSPLLASDRKCGTYAVVLDSPSHCECIAIKAHFISPSQFSCLMEKDRLIRSLWNHIQPSTIILLNPSLPRNGNILARIQHQRRSGSIYNEMVDHSYNRNHGIQMNLMMLLDPTTAYPSYGMEVQEVQAR